MPLADRDIDAEIASEWAKIREKHAEPEVVEEAAPEPAEAVEAVEAEAPKEEQKADRARDDAGRFAKQEAKPEPKEAPKEAPIEAAKPVEAEAPAEQARDINRPPSTWKPGARAEWEKLPPAIRAEVHRRESDFLAGQSKLLPDAKFGASMRQVVQPYEALIASRGGQPDNVVANLLRTAAVLHIGTAQQKLDAVTSIAREYGIDLRQLAPQIGQPGGQPQIPAQGNFADPRVDQIMTYMRQQEQARVDAEKSERETAALKWMNETDAQGNPVRPYVNDVMDEMAALVPQVRTRHPEYSHAQVLEEAYQSAVWAHPEVRTVLQQKQQTELEAKRRAENQQRVAEAKKSASVNVPRRASIPVPGKPGRLEDTIAESARALGLIST